MLQRIHNILAWITINTKTEASIWALKLQTKLTNRYPHLNPPSQATLDYEELIAELTLSED